MGDENNLSSEEMEIFSEILHRLRYAEDFKGIYCHEVESRIKLGLSEDKIYEECLEISKKMTEEELPF